MSVKTCNYLPDYDDYCIRVSKLSRLNRSKAKVGGSQRLMQVCKEDRAK